MAPRLVLRHRLALPAQACPRAPTAEPGMSGGCCGRQSLRVRRRLLSCSPHRRQIHRYEHGRCCTGLAGGDSFLWRSRVAPRRRETDAKEAPASTPCAKRQRRCRSLVKTEAPAQATPCLKPPPPGDSPALAIDAGVPTHPWKATVKARPGRAGLRCLCRGRSRSRSAPLCTLCTAFVPLFPPQLLYKPTACRPSRRRRQRRRRRSRPRCAAR